MRLPARALLSRAPTVLLERCRSYLEFPPFLASGLTSGKCRKQWRAILDGSVWATAGLILTGALPSAVLANPKGATVAAGNATIERSASRVDIRQTTSSAVIDWHSFSIKPGEVTQFHQPSSTAIALNRVTGTDPSHIFGSLIANGQLVLVNPNGILFGAGSRIDVSGLVATTTDIRNRDFMAGRLEFSTPSDSPGASVINEGRITISSAGHAALVAPHVRNSGVIDARLGKVTLGAAETFAIDLYGDDLVTFRVGVRKTPVDAEGNPVSSLIANDGRILADAGTVRLAARNVEAVVRNVINTDGVIYANAMERKGGKIIIKAAGQGSVAMSGQLTAQGGTVDISGDEDVSVTNATVTAASVAVAGDADRSGAGDLNQGPTGGDIVVTDTVIDAEDVDGDGGWVGITADRVALFGDTAIDADGATVTSDGGDVQIGGDFQGKGETRNADATIVSKETTISANAGESGMGGRVILWADDYTRFHGGISAKGGTNDGDGGFAEVSGKRNLDFAGAVDLTAANGAVGTLFLDPTNIIVATGGGAAATDVDQFADPGVTLTVDPATLNAVGGNVTLQALNDITITNAVNLTTAGASFTATAVNDINVNDHITTNNAAINLTADSTGLGLGNVSVAASKTITSGGNTISLKANDITLSGAVNSGAGTTTILVSDGGNVLLGGGGSGNMTISGSELQNIAAGNLTIGDATNGTVTIKGISAANSNNVGTVTLNATKGGSTIDTSGGGGTFNALTLNATDAISLIHTITTDTGAFTVNSGNGVTFNDDITSAGAVTVNADSDNNGSGTFTIASTKSVNSSNNALSVTANKINLAGSLNSGGAATTLLASNGAAINLGSGTDAAGNTVELSNGELQSITASSLGIGDGTAGAITVSADVTPGATAGAGVTTVHLSTGSTITATAGGVIETNLALSAAGTVTVTDTNTDIDTLAIFTSTGNVTHTDADGFTVSTVSGVNGVDTNAGAVALTATTGNITVANTAAANDIEATSTVALTATADNAAITVQASADVESTGGAHSYTADDLEFTGTVTATGQTVTLKSSTAGDAIDVGDPGGGGDNVANTLELAGAEIQNITATNLTIGDSTSGSMTVAGISAANSNNISGATTLNATAAGRSITFQTTASTFNALTANADDLIAVNANIITDTGNLALDGDADNAADTNDRITFGAGVTVTAAGSLTLGATTGGMTGAGGVTLNSGNGLTLNDNLTTAGATVIDTDTDNNGTGTFTVAAAKALSTGGNTLSIAADDIDISGTINTGAAATTLLVSDGGTIGLGATAGNLTISGAELQNITATGLTIGDATNGTVTVDGITAVNSNNISGTVTLNATKSLTSAIFQNGASTFNALTVNTDSNVTANTTVTTDTGGLSFSGRSGITLNANVSSAGATIMIADNNASGTGQFTIAGGNTLSTNNNTLSITTNDIDVSGNFASGSAATTILQSQAGGTIGLGATAGTMTISGAELQNITATGLTIGNATNGAVTVDGITAANSNNVSGTVTLNATRANTGATFQNTASTFNALVVNADDQIAVNADITTDTGNLTLDGDADNAADTNDTLTLSASRTLTSAGSLTLDATTGGITGAGAVTLNANNGVTLSAAYTGSGTTIVNADVDGNTSGNVTASTINVGANSLSATGVNVNTGTSLTAGATTLNGAVTGSGLTVTSLTLTGASAALTSTTVGGETGSAAAVATTMPDATTHLVNGCQKAGCAPPSTDDIDAVLVDPGTGSGTGGATDTGSSGGGSDAADSGSSEAADGGTGGDSGVDTGGDTVADTGGDTASESGGSGSTTETASSENGDSTGTSGSWAESSFNAAAGDTVLTESAATFSVFFEMLQDEGADSLDLLEASENLGNSEVSSLVAALGEILGEYAFVAASIPTNAFDDKAQTILPGLLSFEPVTEGVSTGSSKSREYRPPSFGQFQF